MIDSHAHLLYFENNEEIIKNMKNDGLDYIFTIGTTVEDSKKSIELANRFDAIFATVAIYPEYAKTTKKSDLDEIKNLCKNKKVVAVGEIGLDFHNGYEDKDKQIEIFEEQLKIANEMNLPFCVHCRNAGKEVFDVLSKNKHLINHSGLIHCYSEGKEWYKKFLDLGLYLCFSGNITYKKSDRSFLKDIPIDRILVETDSPYLAPEPLRGSVNQPKNVRFVIQKIADEIGMSFDEFEKITAENTKRFYFGEIFNG